MKTNTCYQIMTPTLNPSPLVAPYAPSPRRYRSHSTLLLHNATNILHRHPTLAIYTSTRYVNKILLFSAPQYNIPNPQTLPHLHTHSSTPVCPYLHIYPYLSQPTCLPQPIHLSIFLSIFTTTHPPIYLFILNGYNIPELHYPLTIPHDSYNEK